MPNIAIYEGGKAARMNGVSLITTDDGEGGKVTWVPQSDRQTGTLHVSENGTYRAEDEGLHSWSKVTVRLAGASAGMSVPTLPDPITGAEIPTGEIGLEQPVPPAGLEPFEPDEIETIDITEAEDLLDDLGYDPSDLDPDSPNYDDAMEAIADALGTDPDKVKVVDPDDSGSAKENQPKVEDKGQKATGTDAETGKPTTITPSGKEGAIVPDELRLVSGSSRGSYEDGEAIELASVTCALYKDGKFIRNVGNDELSFPVTVATYDGNRIDYTDDQGLNFVMLNAVLVYNFWQRYKTGQMRETAGYVTSFVGVLNGEQVGFSADNSFTLYATVYRGNLFLKSTASGIKSFGMSTVRPAPAADTYPKNYGRIFLSGTSYRPKTDRYTICDAYSSYITSVPESTVDPRLGESGPIHAAGQRQDVPVQWSGDGTSLSTTFSIMVYMDNVD